MVAFQYLGKRPNQDDTFVATTNNFGDITMEDLVAKVEKAIKANTGLDHSGTTFTVVTVTKGEDKNIQITTASAGDSPAMIFRKRENDGPWFAIRLTEDDHGSADHMITNYILKSGFNEPPKINTSDLPQDGILVVASDGAGLMPHKQEFVNFLNANNIITPQQFDDALKQWVKSDSNTHNGDNCTAVTFPLPYLKDTTVIGGHLY